MNEENKAANKVRKNNVHFNRVKVFKEMNLIERLEYLANFPKALPPVPCVFITEEKNYQGYLVEYNDQEITIRIPNQDNRNNTSQRFKKYYDDWNKKINKKSQPRYRLANFITKN